MNTNRVRPGYYVEGKYFAFREAQAMAFAQFRAGEFGRDVKVEVVWSAGRFPVTHALIEFDQQRVA